MRLIGDKLKASLLQDAFQGKLTKQLPEDGDARDLLKEIQAEKERLVKEKKIKEEKPFPVIKDEEIPFDIPKNWVWTRLGNIAITNIGLTYDNKNITNIGTIVLRSGNIQNNKIDLTEVVKVNLNIPETKKCHRGDLLICARNGSKALVGKAALIEDDGMSFGAFMALVRSRCNPFIHYFLQSGYYRASLDGIATTTINQITQRNLKLQLIPLPPLAEQRRIVDKLKTAIEKTDELKFFETKLSELEKSFPSKLKASLLQDAFQGKLTKQLPEDGDARDLLKEIKAENDRLVEEKKIKKEKPSPVIKDEEIPFNIPKNWVWARLGKIGYWSSGKTPNRTNFDYYNDGTYNWLKTGDLTDGNITSTSEKITEKALRETSVKLLPRGSVLIAMYGATIGKLGILEVESTTNQACCGCIPYNGILNYYLFYFLLFSRKKFIEMGAGCAQPNISKEKIINTIIPVPPLAEQRRIVDKLKTALEKIDSLNES